MVIRNLGIGLSFMVLGLGPWCCWTLAALYGSFRKLGVPYLGGLIIRILLFRVLY